MAPEPAGARPPDDQTVPYQDGQTLDLPAARPDEAVTLQHTEPAEFVPLAGAPTVPGYELLGELGRGGMGVVYLARHLALKRIVALKMVLAGEHAGAMAIERFHREAEAVARLQHANIVAVHEIGAHQGRPFFSLEYCGGGSLEKKLAGTPLPPHEAARIVETLAQAVQAAHHENVIHRDLKPANILLTADGTPKISDFGLAKKLDESSQTGSGTVVGTPSYMAPEQARGEVKQVGPSADIYALGAILYECLTGRPPFKGPTAVDTMMQAVRDEPVPPTRLQPHVPRDLETICLKCLHKTPERRYASAAELADDLGRFLRDEPIRARPVGLAGKLLRWCRRNPAVAALSAVIAIALVLSLINLVHSLASVEALARRNQQLLAESLAGRLDERIRSDAQAVVLLSRAAEVKALLSAPLEQRPQHLPAARAALASVLHASADFSAAFVLDAAGTALASTNPAHPGKSYAFRDYYREAMRGRAFQSRVLLGTSTHELGMYYSAPVLGDMDRILGVVVVKLDAAILWQVVESLDVGESGGALLVDEDGILIAHHDRSLLLHSVASLSAADLQRIDPQTRFQSDAVASLDIPALEALHGARTPGSLEYTRPTDGTRRAVAYAPLHERTWVLGIDQDHRQFSGPQHLLVTRQLAGLALVGGLLALLGIQFLRRARAARPAP